MKVCWLFHDWGPGKTIDINRSQMSAAFTVEGKICRRCGLEKKPYVTISIGKWGSGAVAYKDPKPEPPCVGCPEGTTTYTAPSGDTIKIPPAQ